MRSRPDPMAPGDAVGVFLPSSPAREPFRSLGLEALRGLGFVPREVPDPLAAQDFRSRPPRQALAELQAFFTAADVKGLWAGRGGYGSNYLLPLLDELVIPVPKVFVASSDCSYLLWYLMEKRQMVVFYGPMVYGGLAAGEFDGGQVAAALGANQASRPFPGKVLCPGAARGLLSGGCLSIFASLLGTPLALRDRGRILILEDVNEKPYRLDRLLWQCEQAGVFARAAALLLGEFPRCFRDAQEKEAFYFRWRQRLSRFAIPVLYDMPFGHAASAKVVPLGTKARVAAGGEEGLLECEIGVKW